MQHLAVCLVAGIIGASPAQVLPEWAASHLGVYVWPPHPRLGDYSLAELLPAAERLGVRVVRLHVGAHFGRQATFSQILRSPVYRRALHAFDTIVLTLADFSGRQFEPEWTQAQYYDLTTYLTRTYGGTNKTFVLGLWETDHWLPLDEKGAAYLAARQEGVRRALQDSPAVGVRVLTMVEVTKVEGDCVATRLLPASVPDVVSLSWWRYTSDVGAALRKLKQFLPAVALMVGELGLSNRRRDAERAAKVLAAIEDARKAGAEWVIVWQLSDWEYGLIGPRAEGGRETDLWHALWPVFHVGAAYDSSVWRSTPAGLEADAPIVNGSWTARILEGGGPLQAFALCTERGARQVAVSWDGGRLGPLDYLPPQSAISMAANGRGTLRVGPVRADTAEDWLPWRATGLVWNQQFAVWQPAARGEAGHLELSVACDYPILGGTLWLCGKRADKGDWGVKVRGYDGRWLDCPILFDAHGEQFVAAFPPTFPGEWGPVREVGLRFWLRTDDEGDDWVWTASIASARVSLDLDTTSAPWPETPSTLTVSATGDAHVRLVLSHPSGQR